MVGERLEVEGYGGEEELEGGMGGVTMSNSIPFGERIDGTLIRYKQ